MTSSPFHPRSFELHLSFGTRYVSMRHCSFWRHCGSLRSWHRPQPREAEGGSRKKPRTTSVLLNLQRPAWPQLLQKQRFTKLLLWNPLRVHAPLLFLAALRVSSIMASATTPHKASAGPKKSTTYSGSSCRPWPSGLTTPSALRPRRRGTFAPRSCSTFPFS